MKHKFTIMIFNTPSKDIIKQVLDMCTLDGSQIKKYRIDYHNRRPTEQLIITVWTWRESPRQAMKKLLKYCNDDNLKAWKAIEPESKPL